MKSAGEIVPRCGWRQRSSASHPLILLSVQIDHRLVVNLETAVGDGLSQIQFQRAPRLGARVHAALKETIGAAAVALGTVERKVGVLQELIEIESIRRRIAMPMLAPSTTVSPGSWIGWATRC